MTDYTNPSKNTSSYSNGTKSTSSVLSFLLMEDGNKLTQQNGSFIELEQNLLFRKIRKIDSSYSYLSK